MKEKQNQIQNQKHENICDISEGQFANYITKLYELVISGYTVYMNVRCMGWYNVYSTEIHSLDIYDIQIIRMQHQDLEAFSCNFTIIACS